MHEILKSDEILNPKLKPISKTDFWQFKTYLVFVTSKENNKSQIDYRKSMASQYMGSEGILDILEKNIISEKNIIMYGFEQYKSWLFDEVKTPFCDEFAEFMEKEFKIKLET
ncbi:hypothetical protein [Thioflexithrix psekupsensis]|uniref:Uncharacterized protein n=1 Tax=Thioflexithrix psekupsensis TaxID=1570016 RepID=A0A251X3C5_9GAMM|nr:hypothetical protein [Thioflexithrix psekupsensis]OUD11678.1 hypothetical protein TPSD3_16620 [Thioflexithrix psekupsensis]